MVNGIGAMVNAHRGASRIYAVLIENKYSRSRHQQVEIVAFFVVFLFKGNRGIAVFGAFTKNRRTFHRKSAFIIYVVEDVGDKQVFEK